MKKDTEYELQNMKSLDLTLNALRNSLREGTLGRHLPRVFAPRRLVAEVDVQFHNVITLAGIKDGKALFEIRSAPDALESAFVGTRSPMASFRYNIGLSRVNEPWFRALVPLTGTLNGATIQLRQPHTFNPYDVGFIANNGGERRGVASRHFTSWSVHNGSANYYLPAIKAATSSRYMDNHFVVPVDSYVFIRMEAANDTMSAVPIIYGPMLKGSSRLAADRIGRKQMRNSANDVSARISAALAMLAVPGQPEGMLPIAIALQDMLGLTKHHPDFHFQLESESASGRELGPWSTPDNQFVAAVVAGAVHTGTRTPLYDDRDATIFVKALQGFKESLNTHQDKVFQANTLFSAAPELSPTVGDYQQLFTLPNLTII